MPYQRAQTERWWWDSYGPRGFLAALAGGMEAASGTEDVWRLGGTPVRQIAALQPKWSLLKGRIGQVSQHLGHFLWSGADMYVAREAAAKQLADYLAKLRELAPREPLRLVAHSHGCNVVKMASGRRSFPPIDRAVFLACPHFEAAGEGGPHYPYRLEPSAFGEVLNLYSTRDTIQTDWSEKIAGPPGIRVTDFLPPKAHRRERDPRARGRYRDHEIETEGKGQPAHSAMHGAVVGELVGLWLGGAGEFSRVLATHGRGRLPVPLGDLGE